MAVGLSLSVRLLAAQQQTQEKVVHQIAKSGDGNVLAVSYSSGGLLSSTVEILNSETGELLDVIDISPSIPSIIALSPNGDRIAHTSSDGEIGILDIITGIDTNLRGNGIIKLADLKWNPNTNEIAYVMGTGINIISADGSYQRHIDAGNPRVVSIAWDLDGPYFATSHYQRDPFNSETEIVSTKIWNLSTNAESINIPIRTIENKGGSDVEWSPYGNQLAILSEDELSIYDVTTDQIIATRSFDEEYPVVVSWNPSGKLVATGGTTMRIWDTTTWEVIKTIPIDGLATSIQWSKNGQYIYYDGGSKGLSRDEIVSS